MGKNNSYMFLFFISFIKNLLFLGYLKLQLLAVTSLKINKVVVMDV